MTEMTETRLGRAVNFQTLLQGVQTVVLLGSIAGVFLIIGRRDATLDNQGERIRELATITADLAKAISSLSANDREYGARLDGIARRIDQLERKP
jgi:hypothetical protein